MILAHEQEIAVVCDVLAAEGVSGEAALIQAQWLAEGDLRGHASHGIQRLPTIVARLRRGLIDAGASPSITWEREAVASVDGRRGIGPWVGTRAIDAVAERACATGIAVAGVHNANHLGMLALYAERAVQRWGVITLALTTSEALVHPWNGVQAMLGTNPVAIAIPTQPPFVLDMATSAVSMGRILSHRHRALPLEPGWAVDEIGQSTVDPDRARALSPFGGAKGYGLALAVELLVAGLTDTALGREVTGTLDVETVCNKGDVFIAMRVDQSVGGWATRLERFLDELRESPALDGACVSIPGDGARRRREQGLRDGIEIPESVWREIVALAPSMELAE